LDVLAEDLQLLGMEQGTHCGRSGGFAELHFAEEARRQPDAHHNSFVATAQLVYGNIRFEANHCIYMY
jgi:hypothetical protein